MGGVSDEFVGGLLVELAKYSINKIGKKWDEYKLNKALEESIEDAKLAFMNLVPQENQSEYNNIRSILNEFLYKHFPSLYDDMLNGYEPNLTLLEQAFRETAREHNIEPNFDCRRAISLFYDTFIHTTSDKDIFSDFNNFRLLRYGYRERYCKQLVESYENLRFSGMACPFEQNPIKIEDVFIKLEASQEVPKVDILNEKFDDQEQEDKLEKKLIDRPVREVSRVLSVFEALNESDKQVILGIPGSGKSTFMMYLALTFAKGTSKDRLQIDEDKLPIFVSIQALAAMLEKIQNIADIISKFVKSELQIRDLPDDYFIPYIESGRCIILFDGLDEVSSVTQRGEVAEKIRRFANLYKGNRYIITSRIAGYREIQQFPQGDFKHLTIMDFDDDQIEDFAKKWYQTRDPLKAKEKANDLTNAINSHPKVKQLATNPLMLTIIAIVHRSSAELPSERIKLYDKCTESLLCEWQREHKRPPLKDIHGNLIQDKEVRRRLEELAYRM
ncbi:MAG: hypothetical protein QG641_572, partial [Candidatus Poribacteria bacterium]|nr:hypothetical protein [Candidatus Poribacteria bacterium]